VPEYIADEVDKSAEVTGSSRIELPRLVMIAS
jgi:hypothetical protein